MTALLSTIARPEPGEYDPYYKRYIALVKTDDIVATLEQQAEGIARLLGPLSAEQAGFAMPPASGASKKWLATSDHNRCSSLGASLPRPRSFRPPESIEESVKLQIINYKVQNTRIRLIRPYVPMGGNR